MALVLADRVRDSTTTTGTGTITLSGTAPTGYQNFSAVGDGNTTYYVIQGPTTEWEVGIGTYTASGTTLSRTTILSSSDSGSAVDFSAGTKSVFVDYPSSKAIYKDASGNAIALGTPASGTATNLTGLPISSGVSGLGAGVATALAVNVGSAGAFVTFNGAGGTPSSMTGTNISGTAAGLSIGGNAATATSANTATNIAGGSAGQIPRQTGAGTTGFTTATFPTTAGTSGNVLTSDGTNWTSAAPAASGVSSITGTANQITVTGTTTPTLSIPTNPTLPGVTTSDGFIPTSATATGNRFFLAAANSPAVSSNDTEAWRVDSTQHTLFGTTAQIGGQTARIVSVAKTSEYGIISQSISQGFPSIMAWNTATSGNNEFIQLCTEGSVTVRGSISYNRAGGLVAYNTTSDYRLKELFGAYDASAEVDKVPVHLGMMKGATLKRPMFVAHELQAVFPWAVTGEKDATDEDNKIIPQQVDAGALIPILWAQIQALRARVSQLEGV
jgi:hypothetical protein